VNSPDWFWEGNVQARIAAWLVQDGWGELHVADTATRQRGVDILARKGNRRLAIEVKGWPSTTYASGPQMGQPKSTQPTTQAANWFGHAVLAALMLRQARPDHEVAIGLPDTSRYRRLVGRTEQSLSLLGIGVLLVKEDQSVEVVLRPIPRH
jgi:hypothetical protein